MDVYTPTSTTSAKINIKGSLLSKKKMASHKKSRKHDSTKEEAKNYKTIKSLLKNWKAQGKSDVRKVNLIYLTF